MFLRTLIFNSLIAKLATGQDVGPCNYKTLAQSIDHFGASNETFQQRYSYFDEFYKPGGPIMFFQGEEGNGDCANTTVMYYFAEKLGGLAVSLEHRYFGKSLPFGPNQSYTPSGMKYLTLDNVMADAVTFIDMIRASTPGANDSKTIVASGSYGGFLATAFRQNHPDTFFASIAAAGPVRGFGNSSNPESFYWIDYVSKIYREESKEAAETIERGFAEISQRIICMRYPNSICVDMYGSFDTDIVWIFKANDTTVMNDLRLCSPPTPMILPALISTLAQVYILGIEFNYAISRPGRGPNLAYPLRLLINTTLDAKTPTEAINNTVWTYYNSFGTDAPSCIDLGGDFTHRYGATGIQAVPFSYIICHYVPISVGNYAKSTIFAMELHLSDSFADFCRQSWGDMPLTQETIWRQYHLSPEELRNSTRIIFSAAQYDPTTALTPSYIPPSGDVCSSKYLYVSEMAHREDLFYPDSSDKPTVTKARDIELQTIKEWLAFCS